MVFARNVVAAVGAARPKRVVFSTRGFPIDPAIGGPAATLVAELAGTGVSSAVIAPELYLENLLMPYVVDSVRERGVLPYAIRADFPVSWASHLDIADVVLALFERTEVTGVVAVGQYPAITGPELAEEFGLRLGRKVVFESLTPEELRIALALEVGEAAAADVAMAYQAMSALPGRSIDPERSAQKLLGVSPRSTARWLAEMAV